MHYIYTSQYSCFFFFFNDTATPEIYTLSLHDALPISRGRRRLSAAAGRAARPGRGAGPPGPGRAADAAVAGRARARALARDRKSTRLNSSHVEISYAVFCLKKKKNKNITKKINKT